MPRSSSRQHAARDSELKVMLCVRTDLGMKVTARATFAVQPSSFDFDVGVACAPWLEFPKELRFLSFVSCLVAAWKSCRAVWPRRAGHVRRWAQCAPPPLTCRTFPLSKVYLLATLFLFLYPCFHCAAQVRVVGFVTSCSDVKLLSSACRPCGNGALRPMP
jgi:hypothetical protein